MIEIYANSVNPDGLDIPNSSFNVGQVKEQIFLTTLPQEKSFMGFPNQLGKWLSKYGIEYRIHSHSGQVYSAGEYID